LSPAAVSRRRGIALAAAVAALLLAGQWQRQAGRRAAFTRFDLPAFDAYAYVAMAEEPRVFTVAPWGYRVLTPALAHAAALGEPARVLRGFRLVNLLALLAAALLLAEFARRLGLAPWARLAAVALLCLSPPVAELIGNPFLVDAVLLALETGFVLALQAGAGGPALALLSALGALAKESFLLLVPAVFFARRHAGGPRALVLTAWSAGSALLVTLLLRAWWTPHLEAPAPALSPATLAAAANNLGAFASRQPWAPWSAAAVLAACAGAARRPQGRRLLARYGYVPLVALAAPFFNPVVFSVGDVRRLAVHALPVLVLVAVAALPRAWTPAAADGVPRGRARPAATWAAAAAALFVTASPLLLDRYRRADLQGPRDGPYVLAFCRESLRAARRLERGEPVSFDVSGRSFQWGVSDPGRLERMRWFLGAGWGERPHYGVGEARLQAAHGELVVPVGRPQDLDLRLELAAPPGTGGALTMNGRPFGQWGARPADSWRVPAATLVRGDNVLALEVVGEASAVALDRVTITPARP
jgi:hypothetical protein